MRKGKRPASKAFIRALQESRRTKPRARDNGSGPKGENSRSEVEAESPQSGLSDSEGIAQAEPK